MPTTTRPAAPGGAAFKENLRPAAEAASAAKHRPPPAGSAAAHTPPRTRPPLGSSPPRGAVPLTEGFAAASGFASPPRGGAPPAAGTAGGIFASPPQGTSMASSTARVASPGSVRLDGVVQELYREIDAIMGGSKVGVFCAIHCYFSCCRQRHALLTLKLAGTTVGVCRSRKELQQEMLLKSKCSPLWW